MVKILLTVVSIFAESRFYSIFARNMTIGISVKKLSILAQNTAKCRERNGDYGSRIKIRKIFILEAEITTVRKLLVDPVLSSA